MVETLTSRKLVAFIIGTAAIVVLDWHGGPNMVEAVKYVALLTGGAICAQGLIDYIRTKLPS